MQKKILSALLVLCGAAMFSSTAAAKSEPAAISTEIKSYDDQMIQAGEIAELNARAKSRRRCWRAVKDAMIAAQVLDDRPTTKYAKQAGEELEEKFGFKKIDVGNPFEAPIGSVLVYGGRGAGHIEIRTADGFVSDFVSDHPSNRPLIGVYVRI
ncbi:MAG TPA: hypothetical protein VFX30_00295 [bacterium]|nr:hypothetical protein [bacterium]